MQRKEHHPRCPWPRMNDWPPENEKYFCSCEVLYRLEALEALNAPLHQRIKDQLNGRLKHEN